MMSSLKRAFKLIKYGFQFKLNCVFAIAITLLSILLLILDDYSFPMSIFYFTLGPMFILQIQLSLLYSGVGRSSPLAHTIEVELADILSAVTGVATYVIYACYTLIRNLVAPKEYYPVNLIMAGIVVGELLLYFSTAYKAFLLSIFLCIIGFMAVQPFQAGEYFYSLIVNKVPGAAGSAAIGLLFTIIGVLLAGLLRRLLYRFPLSKLAGGSKLSKQI